MRIAAMLLFLLAVAGAQDGKDCDNCRKCWDCSDCTDSLVSARKQLRYAGSEFRKLTRFERIALTDSRKATLEKSATGKALAPTFGAAADLLHAAAALESMAARKETNSSRVCAEMSRSYRALARTLAGKKSCPEPKYKDLAEASKAIVKAKEAYTKAKELWAAAGKLKADKEETTAWRMIRNGDPRHRAMALNMKMLGKAHKSWVPAAQGTGGTDAATACIKAAGELHKLAASPFDGVKTEKPAPEPPPIPT